MDQGIIANRLREFEKCKKDPLYFIEKYMIKRKLKLIERTWLNTYFKTNNSKHD